MLKSEYSVGILSAILLGIFLIGMTISGCASMSNTADIKNIKTGRDEADKDCKDLGKVTGKTISTRGTQEDALKDMQQEAANKGANYLRVLEYSASGTSVTGHAYLCP